MIGLSSRSRPPVRKRLSARSVAGQVFILQLVVVVLLIAAAIVALVLQARRDSTRDAEHQSLAAAQAFANAPGTREALQSRDPTALLQPRAEAARRRAGLDFLSVLSVKGIRYTAPDPRLIGRHAVGDIRPAAHGKAFT